MAQAVGTIDPPLEPGIYDVTVTPVDAMGNLGTDTTVDELTIQAEGPAVPAAVDHLVSVSMGSTHFDRRTGQMSMEMVVTNTSETAISGPVWIVVASISDPNVTLAASDGLVGGSPYIDQTNALAMGDLIPARVSQRGSISTIP